MKTLYVAVSFLMTLGIILGIYASSYNEFNLNGASLSYTTELFDINTTNVQVTQAASIGNNTISTSGCNIFCSVWNSIVSAGNYICNSTNGVFCATHGVLNATDFAQHGILNGGLVLSNVNAQGKTTSSNTWLKLFNNPLDSALSIMGLFLGLGLLAGLLGAGLLARVVASVGIGLSIITYIEGSLGAFGSLPTLIYIGFNGIIGLLLLIIAWEAFNAPGGAT